MDYRKFYKDYYGIDFNSNYDVHHLDFNHENNDIKNLLLLPKTLHNKYHVLIRSLGGTDGNLKIDAHIRLSVSNYHAPLLIELGGIIQEIEKWIIKKLYLDLQKQHEKMR